MGSLRQLKPKPPNEATPYWRPAEAVCPMQIRNRQHHAFGLCGKGDCFGLLQDWEIWGNLRLSDNRVAREAGIAQYVRRSFCQPIVWQCSSPHRLWTNKANEQ